MIVSPADFRDKFHAWEKDPLRSAPATHYVLIARRRLYQVSLVAYLVNDNTIKENWHFLILFTRRAITTVRFPNTHPMVEERFFSGLNSAVGPLGRPNQGEKCVATGPITRLSTKRNCVETCTLVIMSSSSIFDLSFSEPCMYLCFVEAYRLS